MNEPPLSVPPAPYPPPPRPARGGGGGSLHYSSNPSSRSSSGERRPQRPPQQRQQQQQQQQQRGGGAPPSSANSSSASLSSSGRQYETAGAGGGGAGGSARGGGKRLPCRAAFVPGSPHSDLYGAVNCAPAGSSTGSGGGGNIGVGASKASRLKLGPPLLEIRRLKYALHVPAAETNSGVAKHETVLVSRGIPGLGGNVSSTCLDFGPASSSTHGSSSDGASSVVVRCATGLTSGALCVHTLSNLYTHTHDQVEENGGDPPSSTVNHYAPRRQRPATAVAWRPTNSSNSNLVAIGLVGGGSTSGSGGFAGAGPTSTSAGSASRALSSAMTASGLSSHSTGSSASATGAAGGVGAGAMGLGGAASSDRDFGALVWDVEAQSSSSSSAAAS